MVIEYEYDAIKAAAEVGLDLPVVANILDYLCKVSRHQKIFYLWRPTLRDPADDMVLEVGVSMNQFISTAVAEKMSALLTSEYLEERAARGDRTLFEAALSRIPNTPATEGDQI